MKPRGYERLTVLAPFLLTAGFWYFSRYPALQGKALKGDAIFFAGLSFDFFRIPLNSEALLVRLWWHFLNWCLTNLRGMAFGLAVAPCFLLLLRRFRGQGNPGDNRRPVFRALWGALVGSPLGLCVNCATPIAEGLIRANASTEFALGVLLASPTFNPVALIILWSLFPWYMFAAKVALNLTLLLLMPTLVRLSGAGRGNIVGEGLPRSHWLELPGSSASAADYIRDYGRTLLKLLSQTLPFMLLAGAIGVTVQELVPFDKLYQLTPTFPAQLLTAAVGTFLPVPITFDLIAVNSLLEAGMSSQLGFVLLFSLGAFSIYPFIVLWRRLSGRLAVMLYVTVVVLALLGSQLMRLERLSYERGLTQGMRLTRELFSASVKRTCGILPDERDRVPCVTAAVISKVMKTRDAGYCSILVNGEACRGLSARNDVPDPRDYCAGAASYMDCLHRWSDLYTPALLKVGAHRGYERAKACGLQREVHGKWFDKCEEEEKIRTGTLVTSEARCDQEEDPDFREQCRIELATLRGRAGTDEKSCDSVSGPERRKCIYQMRLEKARAMHNPELCGDYQSCRLALRLEEAGRRMSPEPCLGLSRSKAIQCVSRMAVTIADYELLAVGPSAPAPPPPSPPAANENVVSLALPDSKLVYEGGPIQIWAKPNLKKTPATAKQFEAFEGPTRGIRVPAMSPLDSFNPLKRGRGIASGDLNGDGWPDVVMATSEGIDIFYNQGGMRFKKRTLQPPGQNWRLTVAVAVVDINNDGQNDIYVSEAGGDAYFLINDHGDFTRILQLPSTDRMTALATGFGDLNHDGWLEVYLGNFTDQPFLHALQGSIDELYQFDGKKFIRAKLEGENGDTNSVLLSDLRGKGSLDVYVANDFQGSDVFFENNGHGALQKVTRTSSPIPLTPRYPMSVDSADIKNDGHLALWLSEMTFDSNEESTSCVGIQDPTDRAWCQDMEKAFSLMYRMPERCRWSFTGEFAAFCNTGSILRRATHDRLPLVCDAVPDAYRDYRELCRRLARREEGEHFNRDADLPQASQNFLYVNENGKFVDRAAALGVKTTYWSWSSSFLDLDDDPWIDLFVVNGAIYRSDVHPKLAYLNQGGKKFARREVELGLEDFSHTASFTYADFDMDGDLDIITAATAGPVRIYQNNLQSAHSITFRLVDKRGNRDGIGAKIVVKNIDGTRQLRELKLSGGYLSYSDPAIHFGLGENKEIAGVEINWPEGARTLVNQKLKADHVYTIERDVKGL